MAPMPLTGTIGTTSSLKAGGQSSSRRSLPEPVVSFHLPTVKRAPPLQLEKSSRKGKNIAWEEAVTETKKEEPDLTIEASLVLLQSLRQSRLVHLTSLLPHLSTRHRTLTKYHSSPPDHPFPGGLDPSKTPHSLIHLGRADVRTGPLIFAKTRFGEVRVEGGLEDAKGSALLKEAAKGGKKEGDRSKSSSVSSKAKQPTKEGNVVPSGSNPPPPPIDDKVVHAVSAAAQKDPKLQTLLHTAANGKANPEELRELAKFISSVSEGLKNETATEIHPAPSKAAASPSTMPPPARVIPPPQPKTPPYPPIITVEYRENPSARFILPLWRGCAVECILQGDERTIKVTMLLPAIGSTAATRFTTNRKGKETKDKGEEEAREVSPPKISPMNPPTIEQLTAPAPKGAETHAATWSISGDGDAPLPDGVWHTFSRIDGAKMIVNGQELPSKKEATDDKIVEQFVEKLRGCTLDLPYIPLLQVAKGSVPRDLSDHLVDKFVPRMQTLVSKPIVKLKRGEAEDEDVEIVRDTSKKRGWSSSAAFTTARGGEEKRRKSSAAAGNNKGGSVKLGEGRQQQEEEEEEGEESLMSIGGEDTAILTASGKPKRKRHVAKYNPDGTLKLCQACATNSTPMWRRGPAGKSTLCNACGAKWKVGRLVVPSELPSPSAAIEEKEPASSIPSPIRADKKEEREEEATTQTTTTNTVAVEDKEPPAAAEDITAAS
ncbi:hypothetical protein CBS101457_002662 [Exobasidium rhododendri]|nr:hypothetical protein CBS101457_002662 [Exobasidium rhododendri]